MKEKMLSCTEYCISDVAVENSATNIIPKGEVVISTHVGLGKVCVLAQDTAINQDLKAIIPIEELNRDYLYHWFVSQAGFIISHGHGITVKGVSVDFVKSMEIPLPPLPVQRRIAAELDRLCALKKNAEDRLSILDQFVKSRFVEMFGDPVVNPLGWEVRKISEFAEVKIGPFGSVLHKEDYVSGGHPLVNPSHMKDGQICVDDDLTLADEKYNELEVYHLRIGDVVVARRGEIGRCALVETEGLFCGTGSMFVRVKGDCRPDYLLRVISFPTYTAKLEFGAVGVTMKNINAGMIEDSLVPIPPMTLQDSFGAFVAGVDKSKLTLRETVATLDQLYRAKLQEYFG